MAGSGRARNVGASPAATSPPTLPPGAPGRGLAAGRPVPGLPERLGRLAGGPAGWRARAARAAGLCATGLVLFLCYLRISQTAPVNSDGASNALQAWDMLHGNLLLHGWWVSDVPFYTTELPQYMLIVLARGLAPGAVHIAAAMTYTLLVLLAGLVARGRSTSRAGLPRFAIAAGIMIAPQLGGGVNNLLLSPDHVGTGVPLLLVWLIIDRARPSWYVPVAVGLLLAWVQVADSIGLLVGAAPLAAVCAARAAVDLIRGAARDRPAVLRWYELGLGAAALASAPAAALATRLIRRHGGYFAWPPNTHRSAAGMLPGHVALAGRGVLELFGANLAAPPLSAAMLFAVAHLAGVALAAWALLIALGRLLRRDGDLIVPVLAVAIAVNLAAYVISRSPVDSWSAREIAAVLPYGAVLAGRLLGVPLARFAGGLGRRARWGLRVHRAARLAVLGGGAAVAAGYLAALGYGAAQPSMPAEDQQLAAWLARHRLTDGLADYWQANNTTVDSSGLVRVRSVSLHHRVHGGLGPQLWETKISWYSPARQYADFLVTVSGPPKEAPAALPGAARRAFGPPARTYRFGRYTVRVWNENLLSRLGPARGPH